MDIKLIEKPKDDKVASSLGIDDKRLDVLLEKTLSAYKQNNLCTHEMRQLAKECKTINELAFSMWVLGKYHADKDAKISISLGSGSFAVFWAVMEAFALMLNVFGLTLSIRTGDWFFGVLNGLMIAIILWHRLFKK